MNRHVKKIATLQLAALGIATLAALSWGTPAGSATAGAKISVASTGSLGNSKPWRSAG